MSGDPRQIELQRRERTAHVVMYFARDGRTFHLDAGLQVLRQFMQPLLRFAQLLIGAQPRTPRFAGLHGVQQRRHQARQVVLEQVVAGAIAHGFDRGVFADLAGHQDERDVASTGHQQIERHQTGEARQVVVGHDRVPGLVERQQKVGLVVDAPGRDIQPAALQMRQRELMVELGVFQMQQSQAVIGSLRRHDTSMPPAGSRRTDPGLPV